MQNSYLTKKQVIDLLEINDDAFNGLINGRVTSDELTIFDLNQIVSNQNKYYRFSSHVPKKSINHHSKYKKGINVLDLFSGAGGLSCGFAQQGFNILGSVEFNKVYAKTHEYNFSGSKTFCGDIGAININELSEELSDKVDIIIGGPPCQTFSSLGRGKIASLGKNLDEDKRNFHYKNFIKYVKYFAPVAFVMENVPGFKTQFQQKMFKDFLSYFSESDYKIKYKILSSHEYGLPQKRNRLFIVGTKNQNFKFPEASHCNLNENSLFDQTKNQCVCVWDAINDLPDIQDNWRISKMPYSKFEGLSQYQKNMRNGSNFVYNNICRVSNDDAKEMFKYLKPNQRLKDISQENFNSLKFTKLFNSKIIYNRCRRLPINDLSWTIVAHIGMDGYEYIHPIENRTLSVREAARLQSFPDNFIFIGNMREQYLQVGNAVPPLLAKILAESIMKSIL